MAPKEKPKSAPRTSIGQQGKPPPKAGAKPRSSIGPAAAAAAAKEKSAAGKARTSVSGQVAVPKGRPSVNAKARTSGRLSVSIDPAAIEKLDSPRSSFGGVAGASAVVLAQANSELSTSVVEGEASPHSSSSSSNSSAAEEMQELRQERDSVSQERDELQAENIRLQRKASQANAVVTKVNDLMDRFQLRDKQQRKELEAAQEQASEHAMLQAEHRKSLTGMEQHAAVLEEQLIALRKPSPEETIEAVDFEASLPGTEELVSELAESRKGNLVAQEAIEHAKMQLLHQKDQVEEFAYFNQSEFAEVAEVKHELEEAIRGRRLYEEEASSERRICQRLQSEAVSGATGASELESQRAGEGGISSCMWRWARLAFLAYSDSVDRSCGELIRATAAATARRQHTFAFTPGARDVQLTAAPTPAATDSSPMQTPTASADSAMAASLQEALSGVQEAKAAMTRALQESEAECAYWANRARQLEDRAEQADAQVRELKEAVLKASALGRASAERSASASPLADSDTPAELLNLLPNDMLEDQAAAACMMQEREEEMSAEVREEVEAMQRLRDTHSDEMKAMKRELEEDSIAKEAAWTQAAKELLAAVKNAKGSTQSAMFEYEEECSAWTHRAIQHSDLVSELNEAVAGLQSEVATGELQANVFEEKVQEMLELVHLHEAMSETSESERERAVAAQQEECKLYLLAEGKMSSIRADEEECVELRTFRERAVAAEHATQQAHSAECALYRLAEDGRVAAKQDLEEEYTKERRVLEDLLEEKTEEAERLVDEVDELRGQLKIEMGKSESRAPALPHESPEAGAQMSRVPERQKTQDGASSSYQATTPSHPSDNLLSAVSDEACTIANVAADACSVDAIAVAKPDVDSMMMLRRGADAPHAAAIETAKLQALQAELELDREVGEPETADVAKLQSTADAGVPSAAEKRLLLELQQERLARADALAKLQAGEGSPSAIEQVLRMELEQERLAKAEALSELESRSPSHAEKRLQRELEEEKLAKADALAKLQRGEDAPSAAVQKLSIESEQESLSRADAFGADPSSMAEQRLQMELQEERLARAEALAKLQTGADAASPAERRLQPERAIADSKVKLQSSKSSSGDIEKRLQIELQQERLAREYAEAKLQGNVASSDAAEMEIQRIRAELEQERLQHATPALASGLHTVPGIAQGTSSCGGVGMLTEELRERDDLLAMASLEVSELKSERSRLLQESGSSTELRVQNAALRTSLAKRIEEGASQEESTEASRPGALAAVSADVAGLELRAQRRERLRWASEVEELQTELEAKTSEAHELASCLSQEEVDIAEGASHSNSSAVAQAVQEEFAQEWASEAALMKTAEDAQLEAVAALAEYAEELQEHEELLQAASLQASQLREEEARREATLGRSPGSRSASILELRAQVGQLEGMLEESCREQRRLESMEAVTDDTSRHQQEVAAAFDARRAAAVSAEHFISETSELRAELLNLSEQADSADRALAKNVALKVQVAALVKLVDKVEDQTAVAEEALHLCHQDDDRLAARQVAKSLQVSALVKLVDKVKMESLEAKALLENDQARAQSDAKSLRADISTLQSEHFDAIAEISEYAEELHQKNTQFRECASELSQVRESAASVLETRDTELRQTDDKFRLCASELSDLRNSAASLLELRDSELRQKEAHSAESASELTEMRNSERAIANSAAAEMHRKEIRCVELVHELMGMRESAKTSVDSAMEELRLKELTSTATVHAENDMCAWWEAKTMQQETRAENLQMVLQNMASTEIDEVNRLKEQLAAKEGTPQPPLDEAAAESPVQMPQDIDSFEQAVVEETAVESPVQMPQDIDSFEQVVGARMAQPALVAAAAGHIASLAENAARKAVEANELAEEAELRNGEELQVQRDLCAHWEAVSMSHKARAEQLEGVEVNQARKLTEQLHGEEARAAKMHTWDHLLAARVSAEESLVAELRGEVSSLSGKLEASMGALREMGAEYRDLEAAEEHHATAGAELHGQLHFQGSECLDYHASASEMQAQVGLMQRRLSEQEAGFRKFEDAAAHELMQVRAEVNHESSRMMEEASELRSESARCSIVSAQEAAAAAAHASALCDVQLTAHKVHADHNAEHECLQVKHSSEVAAAEEHQEVALQHRRELEEHQQELARMDFVVQEYSARAQVHHDIAEARAVELGDVKRRLSTEEGAWWSSERACAMAHGALQRVTEMVENNGSAGRDSTARTLDCNSSDGVAQLAQLPNEGHEAVADIDYRARELQEHMPPSVIAADVALGQAMCTLQNAADAVIDAHFGLRGSPQKPHEELLQGGSYSDQQGISGEIGVPSDQAPGSSFAWLLPSSATPAAPPDERIKDAEAVLIKAGGALRASADALRGTRSDLERETWRHNMQAVHGWTLTPEDSMHSQVGASGVHALDEPVAEQSLDEHEQHSRSRLTAAAQGVFIAVASKRKHAVKEEHAADLARRAHAQLRSEHFLLEAEIASERHEAFALQSKVERLEISVLTEEHRNTAGSKAVQEEMSVLKQEQALQLQEATVRLWELSHHLEDRSSIAKSQLQEADTELATNAGKLHSLATTEVHRAEMAEASAQDRYEELQSLMHGDAAMLDMDGDALPCAAAAASVAAESLEPQMHEAAETVELSHSVSSINLAQVEIEAMQHQEESEALQQECAEMLEEIRQHAPGVDLGRGIVGHGTASHAAEPQDIPSGDELQGNVKSRHHEEPSDFSGEAQQFWRALADDSKQGSFEMQQLAVQAQHMATATAMKHRSELQACEDECNLLKRSCEHHHASERHMHAAALAGSSEAQELAAYVAVEEAAWRATHESSFARQAEHAKTNERLEDLCNTLTQRNSCLSERHEEVISQFDTHSTAEHDTLKASLLKQRHESAELQDCLRLADVQAESTTARLADVNLKQQAFVEECDAREAALTAELAAVREEGSFELVLLHEELKQREGIAEESCTEFEQRLRQEAASREARLCEELNLESRKCTEFMEELQTCMRDLADLQRHASEFTELHRSRDAHRALTDEEQNLQHVRFSEEIQTLLETIADVEADKNEEGLREAAVRSAALETETEMQEALVVAAEDRSHLEETLGSRMRSQADECRQLEEALASAVGERSQLEQALASRQHYGQGGREETELHQARTEIHALEQVAELHAQHSLKVHRLMCEDAQQRVGGERTRPVRNSALRQWQARVADQSQVLLERSWTLLHRSDSPSGTPPAPSDAAHPRNTSSAPANLQALEDSRADSAAGIPADAAT